MISVGGRPSHTIFKNIKMNSYIKMIDFGRGDVFTKLKLVDGIMDVWRFLDVEEACIAS